MASLKKIDIVSWAVDYLIDNPGKKLFPVSADQPDSKAEESKSANVSSEDKNNSEPSSSVELNQQEESSEGYDAEKELSEEEQHVLVKLKGVVTDEKTLAASLEKSFENPKFRNYVFNKLPKTSNIDNQVYRKDTKNEKIADYRLALCLLTGDKSLAMRLMGYRVLTLRFPFMSSKTIYLPRLVFGKEKHIHPNHLVDLMAAFKPKSDAELHPLSQALFGKGLLTRLVRLFTFRKVLARKLDGEQLAKLGAVDKDAWVRIKSSKILSVKAMSAYTKEELVAAFDKTTAAEIAKKAGKKGGYKITDEKVAEGEGQQDSQKEGGVEQGSSQGEENSGKPGASHSSNPVTDQAVTTSTTKVTNSLNNIPPEADLSSENKAADGGGVTGYIKALFSSKEKVEKKEKLREEKKDVDNNEVDKVRQQGKTVKRSPFRQKNKDKKKNRKKSKEQESGASTVSGQGGNKVNNSTYSG